MARRGTGAAPQVISGAFTNATSCTISFRYKPTDLAATGTLRYPVGFGPSNDASFLNYIHSHSTAQFVNTFTVGTTSGFEDVNFTTVPSTAFYQHMGMTCDGTTIKAFYNGWLENAVTLSGTVDTASGTFQLFQNSNPVTTAQDCSLEDVAFWRVALPHDAMLALAEQRYEPTDIWRNMLDVYWPLIGKSPEPDWSGNVRNGTVTNTTLVEGPPPPPRRSNGALLPFLTAAAPAFKPSMKMMGIGH